MFNTYLRQFKNWIHLFRFSLFQSLGVDNGIAFVLHFLAVHESTMRFVGVIIGGLVTIEVLKQIDRYNALDYAKQTLLSTGHRTSRQNIYSEQAVVIGQFQPMKPRFLSSKNRLERLCLPISHI